METIYMLTNAEMHDLLVDFAVICKPEDEKRSTAHIRGSDVAMAFTSSHPDSQVHVLTKDRLEYILLDFAISSRHPSQQYDLASNQAKDRLHMLHRLENFEVIRRGNLPDDHE